MWVNWWLTFNIRLSWVLRVCQVGSTGSPSSAHLRFLIMLSASTPLWPARFPVAFWCENEGSTDNNEWWRVPGWDVKAASWKAVDIMAMACSSDLMKIRNDSSLVSSLPRVLLHNDSTCINRKINLLFFWVGGRRWQGGRTFVHASLQKWESEAGLIYKPEAKEVSCDAGHALLCFDVRDLSYQAGWDFYDPFRHVYLKSLWLSLVNFRHAKGPRGTDSPLGDLFLLSELQLHRHCHTDQKAHVYCPGHMVEKISQSKPCIRFPAQEDKNSFCLETKIVLREPWACLWAALPSCWQTHCFGFVSLISSSLSLPMTAWGSSTKVKLQWTLFFLGQKEARVRERWGEGFSWVLRG